MPWKSDSRGEILVIDDDVAARNALSGTLQEVGYEVVCFADGAALLSHARTSIPVCVFLEVRAADCCRLGILKKLRTEDFPAPIFVTSANGDISMAVDAIKNGAFDFIEKPFMADDIVHRIDAANDEQPRPANVEIEGLSLHLPGCEPFTRREREVLVRIAAGETSKEAARTLGLSSRTVEGYRASIMRKVGARNAAELLRLVLGDGRSA